MFTAMVLVFVGTTLTGLGVYDRIGKYAGAGSIVPITALPIRWPLRPWSFGGKDWCWAWVRACSPWRGRVLAYGITASILVGSFTGLWGR